MRTIRQSNFFEKIISHQTIAYLTNDFFNELVSSLINIKNVFIIERFRGNVRIVEKIVIFLFVSGIGRDQRRNGYANAMAVSTR